MLNILVICVGKLKEKFYTDAANEYIKRLSGHCKLDIHEIPEYRLSTGSAGQGKAGSSESSNNYTVSHRRSDAAAENTQRLNSQNIIALDKERAAIEAKIPAGTVIIALCVEGRDMDSQGLAGFLADCGIRGASRLCFIIGGSFGLHEDLKSKADIKLSMSKMTFPHNLARVMLLEQLYRAFKITEGGKYHK